MCTLTLYVWRVIEAATLVGQASRAPRVPKSFRTIQTML